MPSYWLFKSEPDTWSWDQQVAKGAAGLAVGWVAVNARLLGGGIIPH